MRKGVSELNYEIREIVKKCEELSEFQKIYLENIGDPIKKNQEIPEWIKSIIVEAIREDDTYSYSHSKGLSETRKFLADLNNERGGVQINADDVTFFNGLGDAIGKIYQYLLPTARVIGPSPAYSTHSSAEAAHANHDPITYKLDPNNNWLPDMEDLYNKVKYNPQIVGILIINPDNPTGIVYNLKTLKRFKEIAKEFDLFIVCDEIYLNIVYNDAVSYSLSEYIEDIPGIALKGISKEFPWPGARCGWAEYYNRKKDSEFDLLCQTLDNAKMIEVSSTKLPQIVIPRIMSDERYSSFLSSFNAKIGERSKKMSELLKDVPYIHFNETKGAFYNTIIFKEGVLNNKQSLRIEYEGSKRLLDGWLVEDIPYDKRFVYFLLAATGICVVPISSFCTDLLGFRITLLENDPQKFEYIFHNLKASILEYVASA